MPDIQSLRVQERRLDCAFYINCGNNKIFQRLQRDEERAVRAEVARLEAECREREREPEEARTDAKSASAEYAPSVASPKMAPAVRNATKPANRNSLQEKLGAPIMAQDLTDSDLLGPRYGP